MDIKNFIFNNFLIKLFSLFFAIILWLFVTSQGNLEVNLNIPLELRKAPSNMLIVGDVADYIDVRLKGRQSVIKNLSAGQISAHLDLSNAQTGENVIHLSSENIVMPPNIEVTRISPKSIRIRLEQLAKKDIKVIPEIIGTPPAGYRLKNIEVNPQTVAVEGAEGVVNKLSAIKTEPINLSAIEKKETVLDVKLKLNGRDVKVINGEYVKVRIILSK
jgi:YbbR domain-containing protein